MFYHKLDICFQKIIIYIFFQRVFIFKKFLSENKKTLYIHTIK
jgi:hypothetical protein